MSAVRVLGLLLVVAVCCLLGFAPAATAASADPTQSCQLGIGDNSYGTNQPNEFVSWNPVGFQSTFSSSLAVMCSIRFFYTNYTGVRPAWGAWHGSPYTDTGCSGQSSVKLRDTVNNRLYSGDVTYITRVNNATGKVVMVAWQQGSVCNASEKICTGYCYGSNDPRLLADPTVKVHRLSTGEQAQSVLSSFFPASPRGVYGVTTRFNISVANQTVSYAGATTLNITVVNFIQPCDGYETLTCPSVNTSSNTLAADPQPRPSPSERLRKALRQE